jgi:hypothetical protein
MERQNSGWRIIDPDTQNELVELTEISFQSQEEKEPRVVYYKIFGGINRWCELGKVPQSFDYGRLFKQYISRRIIKEN